MRHSAVRILVVVSMAVLASNVGHAQEDRDGCADHPLVTRLPDFFIEGCKDEEFASYTFDTPEGQKPVEGHWISISYRRPMTAPEMSGLEMIRNYTNAITEIGGKVVYEGRFAASMMVVVEDREVWLEVSPYGKRAYRLDFIEKQMMTQRVVADAAALLADLSRAGHVVVHGIYFDTDKAVVKPESKAALSEIAKLLRDNADLKVFIVGHTDMTGDLGHNLDLSERRAAAVVEALVAGHGVSADRLAPRGVGPLAPVASNDTEAGRALNRRVEIVKR